MLNRVTIMGRLTTAPETRTTKTNDVTVVNFSLAVERDYKNQATGERDADFFDITAWRGLGDFAVTYLHKGDRVVVDGHLESGVYTRKDDGSRRKRVYIVAENIYFASDRRRESAPAEDQDQEIADDGDLPF